MERETGRGVEETGETGATEGGERREEKQKRGRERSRHRVRGREREGARKGGGRKGEVCPFQTHFSTLLSIQSKRIHCLCGLKARCVQAGTHLGAPSRHAQSCLL